MPQTRSRSKLLRELKEQLAYKRWRDRSRWVEVRVGHPITDYFPVAGAAFTAFLNEMNTTPPMLGDRIRIEPGEARDVTTVGELFDVEKAKYRKKFTLVG